MSVCSVIQVNRGGWTEAGGRSPLMIIYREMKVVVPGRSMLHHQVFFFSLKLDVHASSAAGGGLALFMVLVWTDDALLPQLSLHVKSTMMSLQADEGLLLWRS